MALPGRPFARIGAVLKQIAPTLLAGFGGPAGALVASIAKKAMGDDTMTDDALQNAVEMAAGNSEGVAKLKQIEADLVKFELDLYWITKGKQDPLRYFTEWPGRFPLVHVKDMDKGPSEATVDVGSGRIDFAKIFARGRAAGIEHYFVEHDEPKDPLAFARGAREYLARLEF